MATAQQSKKLEHLVEQKILEFLGDPDSGLTLKKSFVTELKKRMRKTGKLTSNRDMAQMYGVR
jgi:hypothetical protein